MYIWTVFFSQRFYWTHTTGFTAIDNIHAYPGQKKAHGVHFNFQPNHMKTHQFFHIQSEIQIMKTLCPFRQFNFNKLKPFAIDYHMNTLNKYLNIQRDYKAKMAGLTNIWFKFNALSNKFNQHTRFFMSEISMVKKMEKYTIFKITFFSRLRSVSQIEKNSQILSHKPWTLFKP